MVLLTLRRRLHMLPHPTIDTLFARNLPWTVLWRLLCLQSIWFLTYSIAKSPYLFRQPWIREEWIPVGSGRTVRALIFRTEGVSRGRKLRPLHVQFHGGAFFGRFLGGDAFFYERLPRETGAVVVSLTYRFAPRWTFPAAIDDVDAAVGYFRSAQRKSTMLSSLTIMPSRYG